MNSLHPLMEVYPDEVVKTEILPPYYKDGKNSSVLKDGYADEPAGHQQRRSLRRRHRHSLHGL